MNMMHNPAAETENVAIDKRIVKEEYRNYDLVARFWEYCYLGKIWKNRKAVEEVDAVDDEGIDELLLKMRARVDEFIAARRQARKNQPPTAAELAAAFRDIAPKLSNLERLILKLHAESAGGVIEMDKIFRQTGLSSPAPVLMTYANVAQRLCDEIAYQPKETSDPSACLGVLLKAVPKDQQTLTFKKDALKALADMDW